MPPVGLLTLAEQIVLECPEHEVEVLDGNTVDDETLLSMIDADVLGFSVWYSNYQNTLRLAKTIKELRPSTRILLGGPHPNALSVKILNNRPEIDNVFSGDSEHSLVSFLKESDCSAIPGLVWRTNGGIRSNPADYSVPLNRIAPARIRTLKTPFKWNSTSRPMSHSYFPISKFRGCFRSKRCEYCSIAIESLRASTAEEFWEQVDILNSEAGIDHFFETADIFPAQRAKEIAARRPPHLRHVRSRCYLFPGMGTPRHVEQLMEMGISNVFYGVESVHYFANNRFTVPSGNRTYSSDYSINSLIAEFTRFGQKGITVMPSLVLGLPGESQERIQANLDLARELSDLPFVEELSLSPLMPLPGSAFFDLCLADRKIQSLYAAKTNECLDRVDDLDFDILSRLLIERHSAVGYDRLIECLDEFVATSKKRVATWRGRTAKDFERQL